MAQFYKKTKSAPQHWTSKLCETQNLWHCRFFWPQLYGNNLKTCINWSKNHYLIFIKTFFHTWRPTEVVWCNRATQSTGVNQQQQKKICFGMTLREWFTPIHPKNTAELKQLCKDKWCKISPDSCAGLICSKFVVFLPKGFTYCYVHIVFNNDMKMYDYLCVNRLYVSTIVRWHQIL